MLEGEPKNGDYVSVVEHLSTAKLDAIREENQALISGGESSQHTDNASQPSEKNNRLQSLLDGWQRHRQEKETKLNGVGNVHHKEKLNVIQIVLLFAAVFVLSTDEFSVYGTEVFTIWLDRLLMWIDHLAYTISQWLS